MPVTGYTSGPPPPDIPANWATAVVAAGGTVSSGRLTLVRDLVRGLMLDGVWQKLDRLWLFAAENSTSALIDIVAQTAGTVNSSPTFTTDRGYTGNGSGGSGTAYIDLNFNASTATSPKYVQDDASFFAWHNTSGAGLYDIAGVISGGSNTTFINPEHSDNNCYYGVNQFSGEQVSNPSDAVGLYTLTRTASNAVHIDINGSLFGSGVNTSSTPLNANFCALRSATSYTSRQVCCVGFGAGLNSTLSTNLYNRLRTYMTAVGVP